MIQRILGNWRLLWIVQALAMLVVSLCATLLPLLFPAAQFFLRIVFLWILPCTIGAWTSCRLAHLGLNSYAAWIVPPVIHTALPWLVIGYPPHAGSAALCALISLVGAAAGDVLCKQEHAR